MTGLDALDACRHFLAAAEVLGVGAEARADILTLAAEHPGEFSALLIRHLPAEAKGR